MRNVKGKHNSGDAQSRAAWHPAFFAAIVADFDDYRNVLKFHCEDQLTSEPLRIDCVIIKKRKGAIVRKSIAGIFRGVNLLEYKNPKESLSIRDFHKAHSYVTLHAAIRGTPIADMTLSFVVSVFPREVIRHVKGAWKCAVEKTHPGIYTVVGAPFPMQFIDSREVPAEESEFLRNLRRHGTEEGVRVFKRLAPRVKELGKRLNLGAYVDVMAQQNALAVQEVIEMGGKAAASLKTALENAGYNDRLRAEGRAEGRVKGRAEGRIEGETIKAIEVARNCIEQGLPLKTVASVTKLSPKKVRELAGGMRK